MELDKRKLGRVVGLALVLALLGLVATLAIDRESWHASHQHGARGLAIGPWDKMECSMYATPQWSDPPIPLKTRPEFFWNSTYANGSCDFMFGNGAPACCNKFQSQSLAENFRNLEAVFGSSPACLYNLKSMWCGYTCSPYQAHFVKASNGTGHYALAARYTNFTMERDYARSIYNSCANVEIGNTTIGQLFPFFDQFFPGFFVQPTSLQVIAFNYTNYGSGFNWTTQSGLYPSGGNSSGSGSGGHECLRGVWNVTVFGNEVTFDFENGTNAVALAVENSQCSLAISSSWEYGSSSNSSSLMLTQQACKPINGKLCGVLCEFLQSLKLQLNPSKCQLYLQSPTGDTRLYLTKRNDTHIDFGSYYHL